MDNTYIITTIITVLVVFALYFFLFRKGKDFHDYIEDNLYEVPWKWEWKKDKILNLKCHCPSCDEILVYENDNILHKTYFLCPSCDAQKAVIGGGDSKYALGIVKREIMRKVRTKEFETLIK